jgi:integrase
MKLSPFAVRTLTVPEGKSEAIFFDDELPGFGLRLRERGSRSFVFQYKIGAKHRRISLGVATALSVSKVRKTAEHLHARVKLGEDPAGDKADAKVRAAETFKSTAAEYLEHQRTRLRPRTYPDLERHLMKHAKTLHELQLAKIERRNIATVIASVAKNSGAVTGNRVRTSLSSFFAWAMRRGLVDGNPVIGTERNKEHSRERVLAPSELRTIWSALADNHFGAIVKLLAFTGQRAGEIAGLHWSEIQDNAIVLPGERTKNHRPHVVPLSQRARAIIDAQQARDGRDFIFGRYIGSGPFSGWSRSKNELDARIKKAGKALAHWTPHDLRRTVATGMAELGVQPHVIEAVLNHVSGHKAGVGGIYNRSSYEREKRAALDLWADHLTAIVEGRDSNVTPLRRA